MLGASKEASNRKWVLFVAIAWVSALPAHAQTAEPNRIPRTLRDGAPTQRLPSKQTKPPPASARQPAPTPSITLDRRELLHRSGLEQRSLALLQREISVLRRLATNLQQPDMRRADALLRLAYAYQELMWMQRVQLNELEQRHPQADCTCFAGAQVEALACAETPR